VLNARAAGGRGADDAGETPSPEQLLNSRGLSPALYRRMTRVVSIVFIGSAMAVVALTGTPDAGPIIVLLALALILIELFQDVLPGSALGRVRLPLEAVILLALLTALIAITGGKASPYFFGYILLVGGAGLSASRLATAIVAILSAVAYVGAVVYAAYSAPLTATDAGLVAFNLVSILLAAYVSSVIGREQHRAREAALELSMFDALTGLLTRRFFEIAVEQEILRANRTHRPFAFILVDMDGLHFINERFGYEGGDELIKAVAAAIVGAVRATDVVARNSTAADEFFVMLPETDMAGADLMAENIRSDIANLSLPRTGTEMHATVSVGVVSFPEDGRSWADLMNHANLPLGDVKRRGGNQVLRYNRGERPAAASTHVERGGTTPRADQPERRVDPPDASPGPAPWESA